jgi:lysophospholipase L1-like esterase
MDTWLRRTARVVGTIVGALAGVVALQLYRLRRTPFLGSPGFIVDHIVGPEDARPLRMVAFGDSTTAGVGVETPLDALPVQLAREVARRRERRVHVTSYGWPGARITDLVREQVPRARDEIDRRSGRPILSSADVVVIVAGANDVTHRTPPRRFRAALRQVLEEIRAAAPHAEVVLAGIPSFRGTLRHVEPLIWMTDQYARLLRPIGRHEAARAGIAFADLAAQLPGRARLAPGVLASDGFHPSALGYGWWARVIADALDAGPTGRAPNAASVEPSADDQATRTRMVWWPRAPSGSGRVR